MQLSAYFHCEPKTPLKKSFSKEKKKNKLQPFYLSIWHQVDKVLKIFIYFYLRNLLLHYRLTK